MPRPNFSANRVGVASTKQSLNPIVNWRERREERRRQAEDEASRLITNKIAENENIIVDKLNSIDFLHSRLPKSVLEAKSNPEQPCGDLEYASRAIIHLLRKNPQTIKMDIRQFDQKLLTLVLLFKQTVEQGDARAAYASKVAIVRAISEIRSRLPQEQPELVTLFVEANTKYLEGWVELVSMTQAADNIKRNVDAQRAAYEKDKQRNDEETKQLQQRIQNNDDFLIAFNKLTDHTLTQDRSKWSDTEHEVHRMMVARRMARGHLDLDQHILQTMDTELTTINGYIADLHSSLIALPIVTDPNMMNKYRERIDDLFKRLADSDARIDETLKYMDDIEGRIQQLNRAPGSLRAQEVAAEEAEALLKEVTKLQNDQSGKTALHAKALREKMGILTEEQMAEQKRQAELEMQRLADVVREQMVEQEQQLLTN